MERIYEEYFQELLGKKEACRLMRAIKDKTPVLITGPSGPTGKTTLCTVLRKMGVQAIEPWEMEVFELERFLSQRVQDYADFIFNDSNKEE